MKMLLTPRLYSSNTHAIRRALLYRTARNYTQSTNENISTSRSKAATDDNIIDAKKHNITQEKTVTPITENNNNKGQRVWTSCTTNSDQTIASNWKQSQSSAVESDSLEESLSDDKKTLLVANIRHQEEQGGRMQRRQLGLLNEDPADDIRLLIESYTAPALASALRDREDLLQYCAQLLQQNKLDDLAGALRPFERHLVKVRRETRHGLSLVRGFTTQSLEMIRRNLMKMPRRVSSAHERRASVVVPLCNVNDVPCILFEKRSAKLRAHPDEVCLPGGMVSVGDDKSIIETSLREMAEEIGVGGDFNGNGAKNGNVASTLDATGDVDVDAESNKVVVLGVLRCNWGEVAQITGIAVTPVVCYIGDIGEGNVQLRLNPDEVAECFSVPLEHFLDREQ